MVQVFVDGITKKYGNVAAVDDVDFVVDDTSFVTLLGPSGCGKTTVLRSIVGVETPDEGIIRVGNETFFSSRDKIMIPPENRNMGMVYQSYALWPHLSVFDNVAYALQIRKFSKDEIHEKVMSALKLVRLGDLPDRLIPNLSGGQQQRVALARALVYDPNVLLLDEPLSNLDALLRDDMRSELKDLQRKIKLTTIYVTHDRTEALSLSDKIILMNEGKIESIGSPMELLESPPNSFSGKFLAGMSPLDATILSKDDGVVTVDISGGTLTCKSDIDSKKGDKIKLLIMSSHVITHNSSRSGSNIFKCKVINVTNAGSFIEYKLDLNENTIKLTRDSLDEFPLSKGDVIYLEIPSHACRLVKD